MQNVKCNKKSKPAPTKQRKEMLYNRNNIVTYSLL